MSTLGEGAPVLDIRHLTRAFDGRVVLSRLDLTIRPGEFVALLGRSGSGKSTLLRVLARLGSSCAETTNDTDRLGVALEASVGGRRSRMPRMAMRIMARRG